MFAMATFIYDLWSNIYPKVLTFWDILEKAFLTACECKIFSNFCNCSIFLDIDNLKTWITSPIYIEDFLMWFHIFISQNPCAIGHALFSAGRADQNIHISTPLWLRDLWDPSICSQLPCLHTIYEATNTLKCLAFKKFSKNRFFARCAYQKFISRPPFDLETSDTHQIGHNGHVYMHLMNQQIP